MLPPPPNGHMKLLPHVKHGPSAPPPPLENPIYATDGTPIRGEQSILFVLCLKTRLWFSGFWLILFLTYQDDNHNLDGLTLIWFDLIWFDFISAFFKQQRKYNIFDIQSINSVTNYILLVNKNVIYTSQYSQSISNAVIIPKIWGKMQETAIISWAWQGWRPLYILYIKERKTDGEEKKITKSASAWVRRACMGVHACVCFCGYFLHTGLSCKAVFFFTERDHPVKKKNVNK